MTRPSDELWIAVDSITNPTTRRIARDDAPEWLAELSDQIGGVCYVEAYRGATMGHGKIPSLWQQAEMALTAGTEAPPGNPSPLAARTPADLDLMEIMAQIRETVSWQLQGRSIVGKDGVSAQLRQLASHLVTNEPDHVDWWTYRVSQWARLLAVYLRAVEVGPKPVRLRNLPCPKELGGCGIRQMTIESDNGPIVVPPLLVDFQDGMIRAAQCTACGWTAWRGHELMQLADLSQKTSDPEETMTA